MGVNKHNKVEIKHSTEETGDLGENALQSSTNEELCVSFHTANYAKAYSVDGWCQLGHEYVCSVCVTV